MSIKNYTLPEIEHLMRGNGKMLRNYEGMPMPIGSRTFDEQNIFVLNELLYDRFD